jgi:hypothetical protein
MASLALGSKLQEGVDGLNRNREGTGRSRLLDGDLLKARNKESNPELLAL